MFDGFFNVNACGCKHESTLEGYNDVINSKDIIKFEYSGNGYSLYAEKKDNLLFISANGGEKSRRDGTYFVIRYECDDLSLLGELQTIIDSYNVSSSNGYCVHVDGLPGGLGDRVIIEYESGEKIYKCSNQSLTIRFEAANAFYDAFHKYVVKHDLDFTSEGSNVKLYDDADIEYLQGTWNGKHFGREISVTFDNNNLKISVDGKLVDDCEYIICEGAVVKNKLKDEIKTPTSYSDYEYFNGVSIMRKKNYFTLTAYFLENSYSTCDLMNFSKEKPSNE